MAISDTFPALYTVQEVAELLKLHPGSVNKLLINGELKGTRLGSKGNWRITEDQIREFLGVAA